MSKIILGRTYKQLESNRAFEIQKKASATTYENLVK